MKKQLNIEDPQIKMASVGRAYKKPSKFNKPNFYFLMGMLTAAVIFVIILNVLVFNFTS